MDVKPGEVALYSSCKALASGEYVLTVTQTLTEVTDTDPGPSVDLPSAEYKIPPEARLQLRVAGPPFALAPTEIHGCFPPPRSAGAYHADLPLVVLRRRTLPWERVICAADKARTWPWLALLVFDKERDGVSEPKRADGQEATLRVRDVVSDTHYDPNVMSLFTPDELGEPCRAIQVDCNAFGAILPYGDELPLLAHVRQVSTQDKEAQGTDDDGWFAVLLANRLPARPAPPRHVEPWRPGRPGDPSQDPDADDAALAEADPAPVTFVACLVSLRGLYNEITRVQQPGGRITLIVLHSWEFVTTGQGSFEELLEKLPQRGGVGFLGTHPSGAAEPGPDQPANQASLQSGHVPLRYRTREGEDSLAWYRGPFAPALIKREEPVPYHCADQARRIDPVSGLENVTYSAAFELGRLLACADRRFSVDVLHWRRGDAVEQHKGVSRALFTAKLPPIEISSLIARLAPRYFRKLIWEVDNWRVRVGEQQWLADRSGIRDIQRAISDRAISAGTDALTLERDGLTAQLDGMTERVAIAEQAVTALNSSLAQLAADEDALANLDERRQKGRR